MNSDARLCLFAVCAHLVAIVVIVGMLLYFGSQ